jgi:branched-chain amino acid transport system ATP-binding protein
MTSSAAPREVALRTVDVAVSYGHIRAVQGVSVDIPRAEITALVGANGAGKSTLLKAIAGLVPLAGGRIEAPVDQDVTKWSTTRRVREVGIVLVPEGRGVFGGMTVDENLAVGDRVGAMRRPNASGRDDSFAEVFELFPQLRQRRSLQARYLSGGEQQMLSLGRSLLMEPTILLIDEPSMGLAPVLVKAIFETLESVLAEKRVTVFLVEQDTEIALEIAQHAYVIERGEIRLQGEARRVAEDPRLQAAYLGGLAAERDPAAGNRGASETGSR